jgi:phage gp16-like protein
MVDSTKSIDRADRQQATEKRRKALVAKVHVAQTQLGMDDDTYRDFLEGVTGTGKRSASILKVWELENVMKALRAKGFKDKPAKSAGTRAQADDEQSRLIRSLWLQLHEAGKVRDPGERALVHWVLGQLKSSDGIEALQWLSVRQKRRIIEQLKQWLAR